MSMKTIFKLLNTYQYFLDVMCIKVKYKCAFQKFLQKTYNVNDFRTNIEDKPPQNRFYR